MTRFILWLAKPGKETKLPEPLQDHLHSQKAFTVDKIIAVFLLSYRQLYLKSYVVDIY